MGVTVHPDGACLWCLIPVPAGRRTCSATHTSSARSKRRQIAANLDRCRTPNTPRYLNRVGAEHAAADNEMPVHCEPGCLGWHLRPVAVCPKPGKVAYPNSNAAHQAQPGHKKAGMQVYQCRCGGWHWGHKNPRWTTIGRVIAQGTAAGRAAEARANRRR